MALDDEVHEALSSEACGSAVASDVSSKMTTNIIADGWYLAGETFKHLLLWQIIF